MQKKPAIFFLLLGITIALAGFNIKSRPSAPARPQEQVIQLPKIPNAELERQQLPVCTIGFTAEKRQINFLEQARIQLHTHTLVSTALFCVGLIESPHKDYLFHIYPTHHFW